MLDVLAPLTRGEDKNWNHCLMTAIATQRLLLRPHDGQDAAVLVRGLNNFNVSQWTAEIPHPYGLTDAEAFLALADKPDAGVLRLAITHRGELMGGILIEAGEIGYWLAETHWGKGYGTEAARAITDHGFETLRLSTMQAGYTIGNQASRRILLGLGFVERGEAKAFSKAVGGETNVMRLELTMAAWAAAKERRR